MAEQFANKIKRLELENFTCFGKVEMDFSPGINVFIGENGTGKTHLLKVAYTLALWGGSLDYPNDIESEFQEFLENQFEEIFKVHDLDYLINSLSEKKGFSAEIISQKRTTKLHEGQPINARKLLYVPVMEMLSWFKGFISAYENRESYIDSTYYFLAKKIAPLPLKGETLDAQQPLLRELEEVIRAKVIRKGDDFFLAFLDEQKQHPTPIVATGINKLAQLIYLIMNGSLTKDTILFWDEPEANLNPKYIMVVAKFLQTLANAGCQIFVATHDYLLPYELSLSAEYRDVIDEKVPDMKFFALYKGQNGTQVEEGDTMPALHNDAILEGHSLHHDREDLLFRKSVNTKV